MSQNYAKRELYNKENIGLMANVRRAEDPAGRLALKESVALPQYAEPAARLAADLQGVPQYLDHILQHTLAREEKGARPSSDYMAAQRDINPRMRAILVDWLVDVTLKFRTRPHTLFMCITLVDRYLSTHEVPRARLQLVGVAALMIVGKYEEIYPPLLKDYVAVCDNAYGKQEILAMEGEMLVAFGFDLSRTSSFAFLELFTQKVPLDGRSFAFCRYLLETALLDLAHLRFDAATLAAGAIFLVNKIFKREAWPAELEAASGIGAALAKGCAKELFSLVNRLDGSALTALKRKFADAAFFEVSKYRIEKVPAGAQS